MSNNFARISKSSGEKVVSFDDFFDSCVDGGVDCCAYLVGFDKG